MTTFNTIQQSLEPELKKLNEHIHASLHSPNQLMNSVIDTFLKKKGKQIRPIMVLLSAKLLGNLNPSVIAGAVAVELLHNASLIHDDVVDETKLRRGAPTINGTWDNHMAVLVGDFFLSNALLQSVNTGDIRIVNSISNLGRLLSVGELDEIYSARYSCLDEDTYFKIIYRKTASLFISCVEVGAYAVGVDDDRLDTLREFARLLGLCFQIKDDIFDYFTDDAIGKPTGNDLREGKITLPLIHALNNTAHAEHHRMMQLAKCDALNDADIKLLTDFAKECGGIEYAYATMERLRDRAVQLMQTFPPSAERDNFIALINFIITRAK